MHTRAPFTVSFALAAALAAAVLGTSTVCTGPVAAAVGPAGSAGKVVVGFVPGDEADVVVAAASLGAAVTKRAREAGFVVVDVPAGDTPSSLALKLSGRRGVRFAEPQCIIRTLAVPDDPYFPLQWGMTRIGGPAAWDVTMGSPSVVIAIVDTGVDLDHPDFAGRVDTANDRDFVNGDYDASDDAGHGTHVAGIAAAATGNSVGVAGVAGGCGILPVKVIGADGTGTDTDLALGIRWATDRGAAVINMSLGATGGSTVLEEAVDYALAADCVIVAATGNEAPGPVFFPAAYPGVIGVGSTTAGDGLSTFSRSGPEVDVSAPGSYIVSTDLGGTYSVKSGTSMATPHVAGTAALVRSQNPTWSRDQVEQRIEDTALDLGAVGRDDSFGHGRLRVAEALGAVTPPPVDSDDDIPGVLAGVSPIPGTLTAGSDTEDVYRMWAAAGQTLAARLTSAAGANFDPYLYDPNAGPISLGPDALRSSRTTALTESLTYQVQYTGWHYVRVHQVSGSGSYSLAWGVGTDAPVASVLSMSPNPASDGEAVTFVGSGSDALPGHSITAYEWTSSAGGLLGTSTGPTFSATGLSGGSHSISLRVKCSSGRWSARVYASVPLVVSTPVWRFYNLRTGVHFYTASAVERDVVMSAFSGVYRYEGVAYYLDTANPANNVPLHRFYNLRQGVHFYTASPSEMQFVRDAFPSIYRYEGVAYLVSDSAAGGATPVHRFYNLRAGVHFYTSSESEMRYVRDAFPSVYRYEGVGYYLAP